MIRFKAERTVRAGVFDSHPSIFAGDTLMPEKDGTYLVFDKDTGIFKGKVKQSVYNQNRRKKIKSGRQDMVKEVCKELKKIMNYKSITVGELAAIVGCSKNFISMAVSGRKNISLEALSLLAEVLGYELRITLKRKYVQGKSTAAAAVGSEEVQAAPEDDAGLQQD